MEKNLSKELKILFSELMGVEVEDEDKEVEIFEPKKIFEIKAIDIEITDTTVPFIKGAYNLLTGRGGIGKSLVALMTLVEYLVNNKDEQIVAFFSEDFKLEIEDRLKATCLLFEADYNDIAYRANFMCVDNDDRLRWATKAKGSCVANGDYLDSFVDFCLENNVGMIVLDPLNRFHSLEENSNDDMSWFCKSVIGGIATDTGACVIVIHHSSKDAENSSGKSRGAGTITDSSRLAYNLAALEKKDGAILLSVIKDNMRVSRDCEIIKTGGILNLPDTDDVVGSDLEYIEVEEVEYEESAMPII